MHTRYIAAAVIIGLIATTTLFTLSEPAAADTSVDSCLIAAINTSRTAVGLDTLTPDRTLAEHARTHAAALADEGTLFHSQSSQMTGYADAITPASGTYRIVRENVGYTQSGRCDDMHSAFMHSPSHRAAILASDETLVGIGTVIDEEGTLWATELFFGSSATAPTLPPPPEQTTVTTAAHTDTTTTTPGATVPVVTTTATAGRTITAEQLTGTDVADALRLVDATIAKVTSDAPAGIVVAATHTAGRWQILVSAGPMYINTLSYARRSVKEAPAWARNYLLGFSHVADGVWTVTLTAVAVQRHSVTLQ